MALESISTYKASLARQAELDGMQTKIAALKTLANETKADHNAHCGAASMHNAGVTDNTTDAVNTVSAADVE